MLLVIDRGRWLRGEGPKDSFLKRQRDGKMCCLGFEALRRGYTEEDIMGASGPWADIVGWEGLLEKNLGRLTTPFPTQTCQQMMLVNDDRYLPEEQREQQLKELFLKVGVQVEFVD